MESNRRALPTGTVTFLFTDIVGSTRLLQEFPSVYSDLLETHRTLIRSALDEHGGIEVKTEGDAFFVAFEKPSDGLAAALRAQQLLGGHDWDGGAAIKVRMGIHTGEAQTVSDDYVGLAVHQAHRVSSVAHGGQVLVSRTTHGLVGATVPKDATLRSLGSFSLKDIGEPEELFQLVHPDLTRDFPPLQTERVAPTNLRPSLTSFVGRQQETDRVIALLERHRIVTITGPGGAGKTRLSLKVGAATSQHHPDGVWMVDLSPVSDPELVPSVVGLTLGMREGPGEDSSGRN